METRVTTEEAPPPLLFDEANDAFSNDELDIEEVALLELDEGFQSSEGDESPRHKDSPRLRELGDAAPVQDVAPAGTGLGLLRCRESWLALEPPAVAAVGNGLVRVANDDLQEAAFRGDLDLARRLVLAGASVNAPMRPESSEEFMCLLHILASKPEQPNCAIIMREIIESKANINVRSSLGATPLSRACFNKHIDAVQVLLDVRADMSPMDDFGRKAVCYAVQKSSPDAGSEEEAECVNIIQLLATYGANLDDGGDVAPMVEAVRQGSLQCVTALLEGGAIPDGLHDAVEFGSVTLITDLVRAEANPFLKDENGKSVMDIALSRGEEEITTLLRDYIGDLQRQQHPHLKTLEEQMRLEAAQEPVHQGAEEHGAMRRTHLNFYRKSQEENTSGKKSGILYSPEVQRCLGAMQHVCRKINKNRYFQIVMFTILLLALFLPDLWILMNIATNDLLDIFLCCILAGFLTEFTVQVIGLWKSYTCTFFFWMDLIGVLSVPLDHSVVVNSLNLSMENAVVMRAARMAKLGARAGRFTKLLKLLRFLPGMRNMENAGTAKVLSACLNKAVSTRVSCLIIIMVMCLPMFELVTYPENDFSLKMWVEEVREIAAVAPNETSAVMAAFDLFFVDRKYYPFEVHVKLPNGNWTITPLSRPPPVRVQNRISVRSSDGRTYAKFNFQHPNQVDSLCNCLLIITIVILMMGSAMMLSKSVNGIVMKPLEALFDNVHQVASKIFSSVSSMTKDKEEQEASEEQEEGGDPMGAETKLLEKVLHKLATLSEITMKATMDSDQFEQMDETDRAVLQVYSGPGDNANCIKEEEEEDQEAANALAELALQHLSEAGLSQFDYERWDLNVADLEDSACHKLCFAVLLLHRGAIVIEGETNDRWMQVCGNFIKGASEIYKKAGGNDEKPPLYHNWVHAVDVTFTTAQLLRICGTDHYFSTNERFALVLAALCHDMGHWGFTNAFLIETRHALAIRYNDQSPLENMHAAKMFDLARQEGKNIFSHLGEASYREVRQVCIEAIFHTDITKHNDMLKEIQTLFDMNQHLFDTAGEVYREGAMDFPSKEVVDFLRGADVKKQIRVALVHLADICNSMKPWQMAEPWANLLSEELLRQGDKEKQLGLPVMALHDRGTVNKAYANLVYIDFFAAPLVQGMVALIPPLETHFEIMVENADLWLKRWVEEVKPPKDEQNRVAERVTRLRQKLHTTSPRRSVSGIARGVV